MSKSLTLKNNGEAFPNANDPVVLNNYKYSAKRMGNAPVITATAEYPVCLDSLWTDNVYVEFRGERYFLKQTPSSSYDNTSTLYKHSIELVSERIVLENVYFFDVVKKDTGDDKPVSNSSEFSFSGDVRQFAKRFEYSAKWSGLDYTVVVDDDVVLEDKYIQFQNQFLYDALQSMYETYKVPFYFVGKVIHIGYAQHLINDTLKYGADDALISINRNNASNAIVNRVTGIGSDRNITYYYPNPTPKGYLSIETNTSKAKIVVENPVAFANTVPTGSNVTYVVGKDLTPDKYAVLYNNGEVGEETAYDEAGVYFGPGRHGNRFFIPFIQKESGSISLSVSYNITKGSADHVNSTSCVKSAKITSLTESVAYQPVIADNWDVLYDAEVPSGVYYLVLDIWMYTATGLSVDSTITVHDNKYNCWKIDGNNREYSPSELGVSITGELTSGDSFSLKVDKRVNVQNNLMPSIYRETDGEERFYNAENDKYKDEDGNDVVFANTYTATRPREYIHKDDEIYPTIEGMLNAKGLRIDMFSEFAFDKDDNDEIYPAGHEREGKYVHPYFFGKLRKFDGEHGFNLFDHAIEGQPMTITMKSGKCAACEFTIGVDEETSSYNTVQVTEIDTITLNGVIPAGSLIRDDEGNVLCGRWPQAPQKKQDRQNDTINYEVWIALKKEEQTFGVIMPSQDNNYLPETGNEFAILNINLPEAYVLAAEKRLEQSVIKYMDDNNDYKFNYSVKLSRIYFEQKPSIATLLNENSKVVIQYNGINEELYVDSYSYNMSDNSPLPEVSIELNDEIKIYKGAFDRVKNEIDSAYKKPLVDLKVNTSKIGDDLYSLNYKADSVKTTAETAMAQSSAAIEENKVLSSSLGDVQASVIVIEGIANSAQDTATQAKDGVTNIGNEIGSLSTSVNRVHADAQEALKTANDATLKITQIENSTNAEVDRIDASIEELGENIENLDSLIGDEYNIWFELSEATGVVPSLDNYPANEWSEDDYENHDRDLYYSQTLGRAWRFNYNEGNPLWEEITDADTITALTRAQEALDKANEAIDVVEDVKYLTDVFGEAQVENSHAATLGTLIAVTNENDNVTAGMYGGGIENLNNSGYKNFDHDAVLMMFAGSKNVLDASNAPFRVYSDGCMYANHGTFGGILKRSIKEVNKHNLSEFSHAGSDGYSVLDLDKTGAFISMDFGAISNLNLRLPWYSSNETFQNTELLEDVLSLLGTEIIIKYSNLELNGGICFEIGIFYSHIDPETQKVIGSVSPSCLSVESSSGIMTLKCMAGSDDYGINVGWEIKHL